MEALSYRVEPRAREAQLVGVCLSRPLHLGPTQVALSPFVGRMGPHLEGASSFPREEEGAPQVL